MDTYIQYVRALAVRGYTSQEIQDDLLARGLDTPTVTWLMQQLTATPGITIAPGRPTDPAPPANDVAQQPSPQPFGSTPQPQLMPPLQQQPPIPVASWQQTASGPLPPQPLSLASEQRPRWTQRLLRRRRWGSS